MTPFEEAGYTKDTEFKILRDSLHLKKGGIVTLKSDDGNYAPFFIDEKGSEGRMWLPGEASKRELPEDLEVYVEAPALNVGEPGSDERQNLQKELDDLECQIAAVKQKLKSNFGE